MALDKGFNDYDRYDRWGQEQVIHVTRLNTNAVHRVLEERVVSDPRSARGVCADRVVELGRLSNKDTTRLKARPIYFHDATKNELFTFLTNDFTHAPTTIAAIYKRRWQIELLFKRIKHNYPLRYFLGDPPNAVQIQIRPKAGCALIADLLLKVVKDRVERTSQRRWSFANLAGIVRLHSATYVDLFAFLKNPDKALLRYRPPDLSVHQLNFAFA